MEAGMDSFLTKPVSKYALIHTIAEHVDGRIGKDMAVRKAKAKEVKDKQRKERKNQKERELRKEEERDEQDFNATSIKSSRSGAREEEGGSDDEGSHPSRTSNSLASSAHSWVPP